MLGALRLLGVALAVGLMGGELWRSWGVARPLPFVLDDFVFGGLLLAGAIAARPTSPRGLRLLTAGFAGCAGMTYGSFFEKVVRPAAMQTGNWNADALTGLVGLAFVLSVIGLIGSVSSRSSPREGSDQR